MQRGGLEAGSLFGGDGEQIDIWDPATTTEDVCTLHGISPFLGRLKAHVARHLVQAFSSPGDLVVDPFCGSGGVALEAGLGGRRMLAGDLNPYALLLTRAKLFAPPTGADALTAFSERWIESRELVGTQDLRRVPRWVREFFHPETLRSALAFRDACLIAEDDFLLACLLGILHHQRPGFLSYPSSHLAPYLRDKKFPRKEYPHLYEQRDVHSRLKRKIQRTYLRPPSSLGNGHQVFNVAAEEFPWKSNIQAVITSPPYLNSIDYYRDNRLRLWFTGRGKGHEREPELQTVDRFKRMIRTTFLRAASFLRCDGFVVLVLGDSARSGRTRRDTSELALEVFGEEPLADAFSLEKTLRSSLPDERRSRRKGRSTRLETVLVFKRRRRKRVAPV